jgi:Leucine-rich repeat (LRR) protein
MITVNKTYAVMNGVSQIEELNIFYETKLPLSVFCLINLQTLRVSGTPFVPQFELDDTAISTGLCPLISHLSKLRVLSLVNTTASHIPHHELGTLTNLTSLEIENCGLRELPPTIALLTKLQILKLPMNHLYSLPDNTSNLNKSLISNNMFLFQIQWEV